MPVVNDTYDPLKIDKLKHFLEDMAAKGHARPYEIFVDNLKVVPKTEDPKEFDNYEYYMNEDTGKIRILIYNSAATPRNDQYCFAIQRPVSEKPSNGLGEIETMVQEKLSARDKEHELKQLQKELEETRQQLEESEEYAEELQRQLEEAKSNKYKLGNYNILDLGAGIVERLAARNPAALEKIGLGGLIGSDTKQVAEAKEETQASFQKKENAASDLKPEYLHYIPWLQQLDAAFDKTQFHTIMQILAKFAEEPEQLTTVAELLNISTNTKENK